MTFARARGCKSTTFSSKIGAREAGKRIRVGAVSTREVACSRPGILVEAEAEAPAAPGFSLGDLDLAASRWPSAGQDESPASRDARRSCGSRRGRLPRWCASSLSKVRPVWPMSPTIWRQMIAELLLDHLRRQFESVMVSSWSRSWRFTFWRVWHAVACLDLLLDRIRAGRSRFKPDAAWRVRRRHR